MDISADLPVPRLTRLRLTRFRSYLAAEFRLGGRLVLLTGPNGAGKTNLLEAISLLAPGRGLRGARLADVAMRGAPSWAVSGRFEDGSGGFEVGTGALDEATAERRAFRLDGEKLPTQAELAERLAMVWLTPQQDRLFGDPASARRRFLDRLVLAFEPRHAREVGAYERAMAHRNRLLAEGGADPAWLGGLEEALARHGTAIAAARRALVGRLGQALEGGVAGAFPAARLALECPAATLLDTMPALEAEEALREGLRDGRRRDAAAGATLTGPHRADLLFTHAEKDLPASLCSTGEQKALLVSTVLAHAGLMAALRGTAPLLLLDEAGAHLDAGRRRALVGALAALPVQAFLTGTEASAFAGTEIEHFLVESGEIRRAPLP
ncbi:DNA replication/repair protein RecF [Sabulicella glaciei]|uniref:DNA replication and repair protein RecF n=1 Tax=Sabulicella glaciei TaxID=2984948 RepID=A0ABT3NWH4_9PROT|nr:DNA replication/repair protein RecF [Roseococcus sp. MDT2-1-1]MCW8086512.1 DNA replication/repair protein RecF [Roseococcus sp. MDT2-1-1]